MILDRIKKYWEAHPLGASFFVFAGIVFGMIIMYVHVEGDPRMDDHYFHFKYAYLLRTEGLDAVRHFNWIYLSGLAEGGGRYELNLFQISLIPFTFLHNWLLALHIVDAFYMSLTCALIYYVLRKARVQYPLFFIIALWSSVYFVERLLLGRAFVMIIGLVFLEMYFAVEKKYKLLFCVSVFHILWHQSSYFMPLFFIGTVEIARYLAMLKVYLKNIITTVIATVVGMAFFPGFPKSLFTQIKNVMNMQLDKNIDTQNVEFKSIGGGEMMSKDFMNYFVDDKILLFLLIFCSVSVIYIYITQKKYGIFSLTVSNKSFIIWIYTLFISMIIIMFGTITISGRIFDFFIPITFVLTAFLCTILFQSKKIVVDKNLDIFLKWGIIMYCGVFLLNTAIHLYIITQQFDYKPAKQTAQWIQEHSLEGDKVFLQNWGQFPLMFFENSYNVYSTGIEPTSLMSYNNLLYWKYYNMFRYNYYCNQLGDCGNVVAKVREFSKEATQEQKDQIEIENGARIIHSIKNDFDAKFIVSGSTVFTEVIERNPDLIESKYHVKSEIFTGKNMEFTVFKLK